MSGIDPVQFGEMCGFVKATHTNVNEMKKDFKIYCKETDGSIQINDDRITALENRNENIKQNWKKAGWLGTSIAAVIAAAKAFVALFT